MSCRWYCGVAGWVEIGRGELGAATYGRYGLNVELRLGGGQFAGVDQRPHHASRANEDSSSHRHIWQSHLATCLSEVGIGGKLCCRITLGVTPSEFAMAENESSMSLLQGSCHCGAVRLTLPSAPEKATKCNCSLCRRLGGLWAYFEFGTVQIQGHPENTASYIWGDKTLRTVRCNTCGCVTHWEPLAPEPGAKHGVNLNNFEPRLQESVQVRHFDGADTWTFLD